MRRTTILRQFDVRGHRSAGPGHQDHSYQGLCPAPWTQVQESIGAIYLGTFGKRSPYSDYHPVTARLTSKIETHTIFGMCLKNIDGYG
ncbi:MAG: hypothetical protein WCA60_03355 [Methanoregula sp.]